MVETSEAAAPAAHPAAAPVRGRLPALHPWQAEALRDVFALRQRWPTRDGAWLQFLPAQAVHGEVFTLEGDGARIKLHFESNPSQEADTGLHWSDYQGRSRLLAWSLAHETQLMRLSQAIDVALIPVADDNDPIRSAHAEAEAELDGLWLAFVIGDPSGQQVLSRGSLRLPVNWVGQLLSRSDIVEPVQDPNAIARWGDLPVPVALRWNGPQLRYDQFRQLRPGDVLVIGNAQRPPPVQAQVPGFAWPLSALADGWRIDGPPLTLATHQETSAMSDTESAAPESAEPTAPDVPVRLDFDLGRLECKYQELSGFQPGYVFALPSRLEGANVVIRANGRDAGRGEIVAVGDTLGVRLISWS
ncbi:MULTISPECIES: type III secretion system cytoplasmic ring protein SctQ [Lysobacter]|uniref:Type III secretion system cytoplasmic ring protein SctQ n=1 Tax=Lysobacter firmicutimachus TaxID=1792846 RepID=A0ABU8D837_9GAMM|nr:type III secretion system cytoplasmic ring protein SctQ [Lysobacter antibioticus]